VIGYVVDASVVAKWYLPAGEDLVPESLHLLDEFTAGRVYIAVPDLFWPEMGSIFWKAVRKKRISVNSADEALQSLAELQIPTSPSYPLLRNAYAIATRFQCTVYDCTYVALAIASERPLVTADERLANALAAHFPIRWLGSVA
jgi:predicted nucleic acid-binding protein